MRKIYLFFIGIIFLFISISSKSQVTVINPANVGPTPLTATYPSLAAAVTDLNLKTTITGPVTISLTAGNPQTTPAAGYAITAILAGASAINTITFEGNGNTITAFTPQAAGLLNDGIFKIIGADFITIQNFIMQENAANTTTAAGTNNMTEWGVALLRASVTDGAQNNTIQNNTISLNRAYRNTFGIYSNVRHSATAPTTSADITSVTGSNFSNKIYTNSISNVGYGIVIIGSATAVQMDNGNDIGGSSAATGNTITNWGGNSTALSGYTSVTASSFCIQANHQINDNIAYNTINSATVTGATFTFGGILKNFSAGQPSGTFTSTISNNSTTLSSANLSGQMQGINSSGITPALSTATINITNNTFLNCSISGASTTSLFFGIANSSIVGTLNITGNIIRGTTSTAVGAGGFVGISNSGAVVNTINITNNQVGNTAGGAISFSSAITGGITGIQNTSGVATTTVNLNNNSVEGISAVSSGQLAGIINTGLAGVAVNINNNNLGSATANFCNYSAATASNFFGYLNNGGVAATTSISISSNNIRGIVNAVTASTNHQYITQGFAGAIRNTNSNTFTNITANTTGNIFFIAEQGDMAATATEICNNNSIVTAFNKTGAGGTVFFFNSLASSVNGATMTQTGNNFSNVTVTGAAAINGWFNVDGASITNAPTKTITGNTFNNITGGSGFTTVMNVDFSGSNSSVSSNTISNITGTGNVIGIIYDVNNNQGTHNINSNTISNLSSSGVGGEVYGILAGSVNIPTLNVNSNSIIGLSSTGASSGLLGIGIVEGAIVNVNTNIINSINGTGNVDPLAAGIFVIDGTTVNVGSNKIHTIEQTALLTTATKPVVLGISFAGGVTVNVFNNFVANLNAVNTAYADAIRGIDIDSGTPLSTYNLYYNSIFVNSASALATFGTSAVYHFTNATATTAALNMIDNIIVNTSASAGVGITAAYRRSDATLTNFAATSNYNLLYAGTPSATNVIFYDGTSTDVTLAAYQTRVAAREANSISLFPTFLSSTDLHLDSTVNCALNGKGVTIAGITTDIDNNTRDNPNPDMGADEYTSANLVALSGTAGVTTCETKTINPSGTLFVDNVCNRIARVVPSGASPVNGVVNTCIYVEAVASPLPVYNSEPYLPVHYDITPATSPLTSTGTITLYFLQSDFDNYNANNGLWPDLPTAPGDAAGKANLKITQYHGSATPVAGPWPTNPSQPNQYSAGTATYIDPVDANVFWNPVNNFWEVTFNVTGFSGFYVHTNLRFALPISFNYLNGTKQGNNHLLNWKVTCNTSPRATLVLERSASTTSGFTSINTLDVTAARCATPFNYTDAAPLQGLNYYRLKMIDADGIVTYSNVIAILNATKGFEIVDIAPNPVTANGTFNLNSTSAKAEKLQTVITDMQGRVVLTQAITTTAGYNSIKMNVAKLAAGTYCLYSINVDGERSKVIRFVKQ